MSKTDELDLPMEFQNKAHEALVSVWWTGTLLKKASRQFFKSIGTTEAEFNLLEALKHSTRVLTQNDLSRMLLVDKSNITGIIDRLETAGLIRRNRVEGDRRSYHITLTPRGERVIDKKDAIYAEKVKQIMTAMKPDEVTRLAALTRKLREGLVRAFETRPARAPVSKE